MERAEIGLGLLKDELKKLRNRQKTRVKNSSIYQLSIGNKIAELGLVLADTRKIIKVITKLEKQEETGKQISKRINRNAGTNRASSGTYGR